MMERVTVAKAWERGAVDWRYALVTSNGLVGVKVERDERTNHLYWLHIDGVEQAAAVDCNATVYALRYGAFRETMPGFSDFVHGVD